MINNFDPLMPKRFTEFWEWLNQLSKQDQEIIISMVGARLVVDVEPNNELFISETSIKNKEIVQWYPCVAYESETSALGIMLHLEKKDPENRCLLINLTDMDWYEEGATTSNLKLDYSIDSSEKIRINYESDQPGWVVVRQNWYPGWRAIIDSEKELTVERVDYLFQGIFVPSGKHTLELIYEPVSFRIGLILTIIGIISVLIFGIYYSRYGKVQKNELLFYDKK